MAQVDQMASANGAGAFVIDRHGVGAQIASPPIGHDVGGLGGLNEGPARKGVCARNDDQPRRAPRQNRLQPGLFDLFLAVGTGDDDLVGLRAKALFDRRDNGGEKGVVEIGNDDRDNLRLSRAQH